MTRTALWGKYLEQAHRCEMFPGLSEPSNETIWFSRESSVQQIKIVVEHSIVCGQNRNKRYLGWTRSSVGKSVDALYAQMLEKEPVSEDKHHV